MRVSREWVPTHSGFGAYSFFFGSYPFLNRLLFLFRMTFTEGEKSKKFHKFRKFLPHS